MLNAIQKIANDFLKLIENKDVRIITHYDTDGIASGAIIAKILKKLDRKFTIRIVSGLEENILKQELNRNEKEILFFCDLASGSLDFFQNLKEDIFILDHHEIDSTKLNEKIRIINPHLFQAEELCSSAICYLFSKAILKETSEMAKLALIGIIGDRNETPITRIKQEILNDIKDLKIKKAPLIFSATRPIKRALEYSTAFYIPGVTGSSLGVLEILRDTGISPDKCLEELSEEEMSKLVTSIIIKRVGQKSPEEIIGNLYLLKFFNKKEDVRELSVLVNACSRLGQPDIAFLFCMENQKAYALAQDIYIKYRQELVSALKNAEVLEKIKGSGFIILNAKDSIKDTIIGTVTSILSSNPFYEEGTVFIGMAYNQNKIKVSARIAGRGRNLKEVLQKSVQEMEAEVGGHQKAAGCLIKKEDEIRFIETLRRNLEIEVIKI